ncbi:MAG: 5'/3'-nucleotidase SurE [Deltaproteobacteria bacterium]|jgi:5'-nucleotidase|nr:5'/3'-nucleotidase SurE [Deltaproteobacteria bacterium]
MSEKKPLILLSNDDGVTAPGILALAGALAEVADLIIAAPDRERSAAAHSISLDRPLRVEQVAANTWSIDGTPVDCVYLALHHLVPRKPDLCLSGINNGFNLGSDVFYSGTVGAALEGALRGVPGIAFSLERQSPQDFTHAAAFAVSLVREIFSRGPGAIEEETMLNVNLPAGPVRGVRPTRLGRRIYRDQVAVRKDLRGKEYYWIGGPEDKGPDLPDADCTAIAEGLVSVTALGLDLTHEPTQKRMAAWWSDSRMQRP